MPQMPKLPLIATVACLAMLFAGNACAGSTTLISISVRRPRNGQIFRVSTASSIRWKTSRNRRSSWWFSPATAVGTPPSTKIASSISRPDSACQRPKPKGKSRPSLLRKIPDQPRPLSQKHRLPWLWLRSTSTVERKISSICSPLPGMLNSEVLSGT